MDAFLNDVWGDRVIDCLLNCEVRSNSQFEIKKNLKQILMNKSEVDLTEKHAYIIQTAFPLACVWASDTKKSFEGQKCALLFKNSN